MTAAVLPPTTVTTQLARSKLGVWDIVVTNISAAAPMTVLAGGATAAIAVAGQMGVPIAYISTAMILVIFSLPYVAMAREIRNAGAFYAYVTASLGKPAGAAVAFVALLSYNVMQVGLYGGFGVGVTNFVGKVFGVEVAWYIGALGAWMLVALFGWLRIEWGARILAVLVFSEIAISLVFSAVQISHPYQGQVSLESMSPVWLFLKSAGILHVITMAGFVGFENSTVLSEEAKDPRRTVPLATFFSVLITGLLYGVGFWTVVVTVGDQNIIARATGEGAQLLFNINSAYLPAFVINIGEMLFLTSLLAALFSFHNTANRYAFAMARDGLLPAPFARVNRRTKAPAAASVAQSVIGLVTILAFVGMGWDPYYQMFFWLTASSALGVLVLMAATSFAMIVYFARQRAQHHRRAAWADWDRQRRTAADAEHTTTGFVPAPERKPISFWRGIVCPAVAFGLFTAIIASAVANFHLLLGVDPANDLRWYFPASLLVAGALGLVVALGFKFARPDVYARLGANTVKDA